MKLCTRCKLHRDENEFYVKAANRTIRITHCKICEADKKLMKRYKISIEDYQRILESQNQRCKICDRTEIQVGRRLAVDHCHETGKVRGLLCSRCNQAVGLLKDNPKFGDNLSRYLRLYSANFQTDQEPDPHQILDLSDEQETL